MADHVGGLAIRSHPVVVPMGAAPVVSEQATLTNGSSARILTGVYSERAEWF